MISVQRDGVLEVISGCMFSGKTEELIRRVRRAGYAHKRIATFDHALDEKRYRPGYANSHSGWEIETFSVSDPKEVLGISRCEQADVVAVDEGQFFALGVVSACCELADLGMRVIVAGLNQDFRGEPFEVMADLMGRADHVVVLSAICVICGREATKSQRLIDGEPAPWDAERIKIGGEERYEARCRRCHDVPRAPTIREPVS